MTIHILFSIWCVRRFVFAGERSGIGRGEQKQEHGGVAAAAGRSQQQEECCDVPLQRT